MLAAMTDTVTQHHLKIPSGFWFWEAQDGEEGEEKPHAGALKFQIPTSHIPHSQPHPREYREWGTGEHGDLGGLGVPEPRKGEAGEKLNGRERGCRGGLVHGKGVHSVHVAGEDGFQE